MGVRYADLDQIAKRYLDLYARAFVKVEMYDRWGEEHGWLDAQGNPPPFERTYYSALNSAGRLLAKLEEHLRRHREAGPTPLQAYLEAEYLEVDGEGDG